MSLLLLLVACGDTPPAPTPIEPTPTLELTPTPAASPTPTVRTAYGQIIREGETGEINEIFITLNSIRRSVEGAAPPATGNEFVILNLTFENKTATPAQVGSFMDSMLVWDMNGNVFSDTSMATVQSPNLAVDLVTVEPGATQTGELALEVSAASTGLVLQYELTTERGRGTLQITLDK